MESGSPPIPLTNYNCLGEDAPAAAATVCQH